MRWLVSAVLGLALATPAMADPVEDRHIVRGHCNDSYTVARNLSQPAVTGEGRFVCDTASIVFFRSKHHVMVQFAEHQQPHAPIVGFAGYLADDGMTLTVHNVYFNNKVLQVDNTMTIVKDGMCQFFFDKDDSRVLDGIFCGLIFDKDGIRTAAIVSFDVHSVDKN